MDDDGVVDGQLRESGVLISDSPLPKQWASSSTAEMASATKNYGTGLILPYIPTMSLICPVGPIERLPVSTLCAYE